MKKTWLRPLLICLALLLVCSLAACGQKDDGYKHFTADETLTAVTDGTNTYTLHTLPRGYYRGAALGEEPVRSYNNPVEGVEDMGLYLLAHGEESGILYTNWSLPAYVYFATDEAEAKLQTFFAGNARFYALAYGPTGNESVLIPAPQKNVIAENYAASADTLDVDVTTIAPANWFPLVAKDDTLLFSTEIGALLLIGTDWYYVDYATLDNSHFDADGYFSFRSGTVTFKKLSGDAVTVATAAAARCIDPNDSDASVTLSEGMTLDDLAVDDEISSVMSLAAFWVSFVLVGFVLPLGGLVTCLLLSLRKKPGARRWFIPVGIAALWLVLALVILILLLV